MLIARSNREAAEILEFQVALLEDDALAEAAFVAIAEGAAADLAWLRAMHEEIAGYEKSDDEYFRARAADLYDIRDRVVAHLTGSAIEAGVPPGAIVTAQDLTPSRFLAIDWSRGGALALTAGSTTSHVAMLARSRGIPAVVGIGVDLAEHSGDALIDAHPYLGPAFEFTPRAPADAALLHGLFAFNYSALISLGLSASALSGMKNALPRLVRGIADQLFLDDREALLAQFIAYDEEEFVGEWPRPASAVEAAA